jgi:hypothetical protein
MFPKIDRSVFIGSILFYSSPGAAGDRSQLVLSSHRTYCNTRDIATYTPTENGTLEYHFLRVEYGFCIGGKFGGSPKTNDFVYISKKACQVNNICQDALSYGEILRYFLFLFYLS